MTRDRLEVLAAKLEAYRVTPGGDERNQRDQEFYVGGLHAAAKELRALLASQPEEEPKRQTCSRCYGHGTTVAGDPCPSCRAGSGR